MKTFRIVTSRQLVRMGQSPGSWEWYAVDERGRYLKGFGERVLLCGRYRIASAPKTGRFKVGDDFFLRERIGRFDAWRLVDCPDFCIYGMAEIGIKPDRAFNAIPVRRGK